MFSFEILPLGCKRREMWTAIEIILVHSSIEWKTNTLDLLTAVSLHKSCLHNSRETLGKMCENSLNFMCPCTEKDALCHTSTQQNDFGTFST